MVSSRNTLYGLLIVTCSVGYGWLYFNSTKNATDTISFEVCLLKYATNIPCPSCGSTRSVILLTQGNFIDGINLNPLGYLIAVILVVAPIWVASDLIMRRDTLFRFYQKIENYMRKPKYAVPLAMLVIVNWLWNIAKGL